AISRHSEYPLVRAWTPRSRNAARSSDQYASRAALVHAVRGRVTMRRDAHARLKLIGTKLAADSVTSWSNDARLSFSTSKSMLLAARTIQSREHKRSARGELPNSSSAAQPANKVSGLAKNRF